jgi:hypothetical protein
MGAGRRAEPLSELFDAALAVIRGLTEIRLFSSQPDSRKS